MTITKMYEGAWNIDEGGVRFFLLEGEEKALLIDSGMQTKNAKEVAMEILEGEGEEHAQKPLLLINTHADRDHIASNYEFDSFYMHPAESVNYYKNGDEPGRMLAVYDKDVIELGDRPVEIVSLPGHTPGSIGILDVRAKVLYGGDGVQSGNIFMFGPMREMRAYVTSLEKLEAMAEDGKFTAIYPSHASIPVDPSILAPLKEAAEKVIRGEGEKTAMDMWGGNKVTLYKFEVAGFLRPLEA